MHFGLGLAAVSGQMLLDGGGDLAELPVEEPFVVVGTGSAEGRVGGQGARRPAPGSQLLVDAGGVEAQAIAFGTIHKAASIAQKSSS